MMLFVEVIFIVEIEAFSSPNSCLAITEINLFLTKAQNVFSSSETDSNPSLIKTELQSSL